MITQTYVHDLSPFLVRFGSFGIRWYGLAYLAGFVVGTLLYRRLARRGFSDLKPEHVADFITMGALFGVLIGGRLGYMLFYDTSRFLHEPSLFFRVWEGGMASHGGILGLTLYTIWYARRHRVSWLNLGDNLAAVAPVGIFFGRCANFINGELYGRVTTAWWAIRFPKEILFYPPERLDPLLEKAHALNPAYSSPEAVIEGVAGSSGLRDLLLSQLPARYPSQLVEAGLEGGVLFLLLWMLRTRTRLPNGALSGIFFMAYAGVRILGECFREPDAPLTGILTRGQFLSLFMIAAGLALLLFSFFRPSYPPALRRQEHP